MKLAKTIITIQNLMTLDCRSSKFDIKVCSDNDDKDIFYMIFSHYNANYPNLLTPNFTVRIKNNNRIKIQMDLPLITTKDGDLTKECIEMLDFYQKKYSGAYCYTPDELLDYLKKITSK